jgi:hypothetical protein
MPDHGTPLAHHHEQLLALCYRNRQRFDDFDRELILELRSLYYRGRTRNLGVTQRGRKRASHPV